MSEYISGSCNIGPDEVKRRKQGAIFGGALFLIASILLIANKATTVTKLWVFIPAVIFSVGLIQSRRKFCVAFGFLGVFNFEKVGSTKKITINQDLKADRKYAIKLTVQALALAIALTLLVSLLSF